MFIEVFFRGLFFRDNSSITEMKDWTHWLRQRQWFNPQHCQVFRSLLLPPLPQAYTGDASWTLWPSSYDPSKFTSHRFLTMGFLTEIWKITPELPDKVQTCRRECEAVPHNLKSSFTDVLQSLPVNRAGGSAGDAQIHLHLTQEK